MHVPRERREQPDVAEMPGLESATSGSSAQIAGGALPPVSTTTGRAAPSASEQAYGKHEPRVADASEETPAPVKPKGAKYDVGWQQVARGGARANASPHDVVLPESLSSSLDAAWKDSKKDGVEKEQGGNIVRGYGGDYRFHRGKDSTDKYYDPDEHDVGFSETLVGVAHTHPYKDYDSVTFSGGDVANMVQGDTLKVVRSGERTYMMARTPEFAAIVKRADDAGTVEELRVKIEAEWEVAFNAAKGTFPEKVEAATRVTCQRYGIVYYEGDRSHLRRVDEPKRQAPAQDHK